MTPQRKASPTGGLQQTMGSGVCGPHCHVFTELWTMVTGGPWSDRASCRAVSSPSAPLLVSCVAVGLLLNLSEPQAHNP